MVSAQTSHSSEDHRASGKPAALFSPKRHEQRNQMWTSVFGNANLSNMSGSLLESNKDLLLSEARSDLAKRELHVESLNKCIGDLQRTEAQKKGIACRTYKTNLLNLVGNKFDCKKNYCKQRKAIRSMHEIGKMKRAQVQQLDSPCEN